MTMSQAEADRTTNRIYAGFFLTIAVVLFLVGGHSYLKAKAFSENMASTNGVAIAIHEKILQTKHNWLDSVLVSVNVDGKSLQLYERVDHGSVMIGDTVSVFYDRREPAGTAYAGSKADIWHTFDEMMPLAGMLVLLALVAWFSPTSKKKEVGGF